MKEKLNIHKFFSNRKKLAPSTTDYLAFTLSIIWFKSVIPKLSWNAANLQAKLMYFNEGSPVPIWRDIVGWSANNLELLSITLILVQVSYIVVGCFLLLKNLRIYASVGSLILNTMIFLTAYHVSYPIFNTNFLMISIALIIISREYKRKEFGGWKTLRDLLH